MSFYAVRMRRGGPGLAVEFDKEFRKFFLWSDGEIIMTLDVEEYRGYFGTPALAEWNLQ